MRPEGNYPEASPNSLANGGLIPPNRPSSAAEDVAAMSVDHNNEASRSPKTK